MGDEWWIQQGEHIQGPFSLAAVKRFTKSGKATREMSYSTDRVEWRKGTDVPRLFSAVTPPPVRGLATPEKSDKTSGYPDMAAYAAVFEDGPVEARPRVAAARRRSTPVVVYVAAALTALGGVVAKAALAVYLILSVPDELGLGILLLVVAGFYVWLVLLLIKGEKLAANAVLTFNFFGILGSLMRLGGSAGWLGWLDMLLAGVVIAILVTDPAASFFRSRKGRPRRYRSR